MLGTREEEKYLAAEREVVEPLKEIDGWICKVEISSESNFNKKDDFSVYCPIDDGMSEILKLNKIIFQSNRKYYKGDIIKISGKVNINSSIKEIKAILITLDEPQSASVELVAEGGS